MSSMWAFKFWESFDGYQTIVKAELKLSKSWRRKLGFVNTYVAQSRKMMEDDFVILQLLTAHR